jgi:protein-S-isoprenylcysteine O-methyltransferase Ste14
MARPALKWITVFISPSIERSTYVSTIQFGTVVWQPITAIVWKAGQQNSCHDFKLFFFVTWHFSPYIMINHFDLWLKQIFFDNLKTNCSIFKIQTNYLYKIVRHPIMLAI